MNKKIGFYGFRGNIEFAEMDLFNYDLLDNSNEKNKIFANFFEQLKNKKLESSYDVREYMLIYIQNISDSIIHCQLARKRNFNTYELDTYKIEERKTEDYPYINVFVDTISQKFLIESKTRVFENPETCKKIIENIMSKTLMLKNAYISLNPITSEEKFWEKVEESKKVISVEFNLNTPNWLTTANAATDLMKEIRKASGADKAKLEFSNSQVGLELDKIGINSFVEYSSEGAGNWKIKYEDKVTGEKMIAKSKSKSKIIYVDLDSFDDDVICSEISVMNIKKALDKIEKFERFKN